MRAGKWVAALVGVLLSGCTYAARFDSVPQGARVYVNGALVGTTPVSHEMSESGSSYNLRFELEGYVPEVSVIHPVPTGGTYSITQGGTNTTSQTYVNASAYQPNPGGRVYGSAQADTYQTQSTVQVTTTAPVMRWPRDIVVTMRPRDPSDPLALPPRQAVAPGAPQTSAAFCTNCGAKSSGKFCGSCGAASGRP